MGYETRLADGLRAERKPQDGEATVGEVGEFGPGIKIVRPEPTPASAGYRHDQDMLTAFKPEMRAVVLHLLGKGE